MFILCRGGEGGLFVLHRAISAVSINTVREGLAVRLGPTYT